MNSLRKPYHGGIVHRRTETEIDLLPHFGHLYISEEGLRQLHERVSQWYGRAGCSLPQSIFADRQISLTQRAAEEVDGVLTEGESESDDTIASSSVSACAAVDLCTADHASASGQTLSLNSEITDSSRPVDIAIDNRSRLFVRLGRRLLSQSEMGAETAASSTAGESTGESSQHGWVVLGVHQRSAGEKGRKSTSSSRNNSPAIETSGAVAEGTTLAAEGANSRLSPLELFPRNGVAQVQVQGEVCEERPVVPSADGLFKSWFGTNSPPF
jgi:hypothetical protein